MMNNIFFYIIPYLIFVIYININFNETKDKLLRENMVKGKKYLIVNIFFALISVLITSIHFYFYKDLKVSLLVSIIVYMSLFASFEDLLILEVNRQSLRFSYMISIFISSLIILEKEEGKGRIISLLLLLFFIIFFILFLLFTNTFGASDCRMLILTTISLIGAFGNRILIINFILLIVAIIYQGIFIAYKRKKEKDAYIPLGPGLMLPVMITFLLLTPHCFRG